MIIFIEINIFFLLISNQVDACSFILIGNMFFFKFYSNSFCVHNFFLKHFLSSFFLGHFDCCIIKAHLRRESLNCEIFKNTCLDMGSSEREREREETFKFINSQNQF